MPRSMCCAYLHVVFSTKDRMPTIPDIPQELFQIICRKIEESSGHVMAVNGTNDHIHILLNIGRNTSISQHVRNIKTASSIFLHSNDPAFQWQSGYAAFSVAPHEVGKITNYIHRQKDHHCQEDYKSEIHRIESYIDALSLDDTIEF